MRKTMIIFDRKTTSKDLFNKLNINEQENIKRFKEYLLISASEKRAEAGTTEVIRFRYTTGKSLFQIDLEDLRYFLKELKQSNFADYTKNKIKDYIKRFLKWAYKDWSVRFNEFEDVKINTDAQRKKQIGSKEMLSEKQIMQLLEAEPTLYWKTFLITQSEAGLRTGEARTLLWENVVFEDDGFTILNITSQKNKNATKKSNPVVVKIAGRFLSELKEQQAKFGIKSKYVFPSPQNPNKPISKAVNLWFNALCKKVLGFSSYNYILRHSKGTELQKKVRAGTLSKDNAVEFMRHSEKMFDKIYSHMDKNEIKQLMKKQIYNTEELTSEQKNEYEIKLKQQENRIREIEKFMNMFADELAKRDSKKNKNKINPQTQHLNSLAYGIVESSK